MKGKIVSYDPVKGEGRILIKKIGIKFFNIDEWIDYENMLEVGLEVEFEYSNDKITNIITAGAGNDLFEQLNKKIVYSLPNNLKIQEDVSLDYCVEEFFDKFKKIVIKYKDIIDKSKTLPYKKVKRFLITAYNNLLDIDIKINDNRLIEIKASLDEVEYYYNKLKNETKNPIYVIVEKLFLAKQKNYQILKKRFENNKLLITKNTKNVNLLEIKIKSLKEKLNELKPKSKEYIEQFNLLKAYKRKYVDLIDDTQNLKEDNANIVNDINQFEKVYKDIFENFFNQEVDILLAILNQELNSLAYKFDTILWGNAKKSNTIQKFFETAKIEGNFSTKTFIKYYLKTLSNDKINEKDAELEDIFNELQVFSKNIIIYDRNKNRARELLLYIENLDHDSNVKIFTKLKTFVEYIQNNDLNIELAIIEIEDNTKTAIEKVVLHILKIKRINWIFFSERLQQYNTTSHVYKEIKKVIY